MLPNFIRFEGGESALFSVEPNFDIAFLELNRIPKDLAPLILSENRASIRHPFRAYGFPRSSDVKGTSPVYLKGIIGREVSDNQGNTFIQLAGGNFSGMSGAPVIDTKSSQIIGMIASAEHINEKNSSKYGYAIPSRTIKRLLSKVQNSRELNNQDASEQTSSRLDSPIEDNPENLETIRPIYVEKNALDSHAVTDKPIQNIEQDKLGFDTYINAFYEFIVSKYTTTPLTISIDGSWGTGKSSLMYMLKNRLEPEISFKQWLERKLTWWKWFFVFWLASSIRIAGVFFIRITGNIQRLATINSQINQGLSIDPEYLKLPEFDTLHDRVKYWANIRSKCEPMNPDSYETIWFNAWKFSNAEEIWASLALTTLDQLKQKHNLFWRLKFWLNLTFSRLSTLPAIWEIIKKFGLPLAFLIILTIFEIVTKIIESPDKLFLLIRGQWILIVGLIISILPAINKIFKDPFQISFERIFDCPNYKEKIGFLNHFERDFSKIVKSVTKPRLGWKRSKLIIFIDDLDRCKPPKSADIIESINLFLDAEGCVFVVGMDSEAVSMSIEVKYKDLFERMCLESAGRVSLGRLFLDKIVQIPFSVPRATPRQIQQMVDATLSQGSIRIVSEQITSSKPVEMKSPELEGDESSPLRVPSTQNIDPASYARPEVREAILLGTELLAENPRQVKTFINVFRLLIYIANERQLLEERETKDRIMGLDLDKLAVWVACSVRWPGLLRHLLSESQIDSLRIYLSGLSQRISEQYEWKQGISTVNELMLDIQKQRENEEGSIAHWCHLPWNWWFMDKDFLKSVKMIEDLWPMPEENEIDWLKAFLTMNHPLSVSHK